VQDFDLGPDIRIFGRILRDRRRLIFLSVAASMAIVGLYVFLATPLYTSEVVLLIEPEPLEQVDSADLSSAEARDYYTTQYDILRSRSLARSVIEQEELVPSQFHTRSHALRAALVARLEPLTKWTRADAAPADTTERPSVGLLDDYVEDWLTIEPYPESRLVRVAFRSPDPALSARVVATHARAYTLRSLELRRQTLDDSREYLANNLERLAERVEESERNLNDYRREHGILSLDDRENVLVEQLVALNEKLSEAEAERISRESVATVGGASDPESIPVVTSSPLVASLKEQLALVEAEFASRTANLHRDGNPLWPHDLEAKIQQLRSRLRHEISALVASTRSSYEESLEHEAILRARLDEQKEQVLSLKSEAVQYAVLEREVDANQQLYEEVRQRMLALGVASDVQASNVAVIDEPFPADSPSHPRKALSLALAVLLGVTLGSGIACAAEYLDDTVRTPEELERYLGIPALGVVPDFAVLQRGSRPLLPSRTRALLGSVVGRNWDPPTRALAVSRDPFSTASEAYRAIRTGVLLTHAPSSRRVILFTSSVHGEGKTTTTLNTAALFAQLGEPVLVIDADLRRSSCQRLLRLPPSTGLSDVLAGTPPELQKLQIQDTTIDFLPSGTPATKPTELLGSDRMKQILAYLRERYAYVLIDSPPLIPVSDAVVLSTLVDGVIVVVDPRRAPRPVVFKAHRRLVRVNANVLGAVVNRGRSRIDHDDLYYGSDDEVDEVEVAS